MKTKQEMTEERADFLATNPDRSHMNYMQFNHLIEVLTDIRDAIIKKS